MKHLSGLWHKLTVVVAVTAALSSCNRAEYVMLPKTTSYHGTAQRAVTVAPAAEKTTPTTQTTTPELAVAPAETPVSSTPEKTTAVATVPQIPAVKKSSAPAAVVKSKPATVAKLTLLERIAVSKVAKQIDKVASKTVLNKHREAANASRLEGKLRQAVLLGLLGLLLEIVGAAIGGAVGSAFYIVGAVLLVVALVLLVLYLLDEI